MATFEAVDLGAASGRVMTARVGRDVLELAEVHRFATGPRPDSIGIDSWAVDFGLLDDHGALLGNPVCYRDSRTAGMRERVRERIADERLYELNGLQFLPFNTIYQLAACAGRLPSRGTLLLIPDLLACWLTGRIGAEVTNASTTGLLDVTTRSWSRPLMSAVGVPDGLLPPLAGHRIDVVHLVGGGSRNELLCQMTADACGIPVIAGPVEATAIGNVLIQARAFGLLADLAQIRGLVAGTQPLRRYEPRDLRCDWAEAAARVGMDA